MPITPYLDGAGDFDAETRRVIGVAFELARAAVQRDWGDYADTVLAKRIIELAKTGERNPDLLCERALTSFRRPQFFSSGAS
jgi:hypothetical protein